MKRVGRLIQRERELMLEGRGAVESAKKQLEIEEAEQHWEMIQSKEERRQRRRYKPSNDERIGKWASQNAEMLYNRKKKRGKR